MNATIQPAPIRKSFEVAKSIDAAFALFATFNWWPKAHSVAASPQVEVIAEPHAGGRWFERGEDGRECDWGRVIAWEPPHRLLLAWQIDGAFKFDPEFSTEIEVGFTAIGPGATRIDFEHRKLEAYGVQADALREMLAADGGWGLVIANYRAAAAGPPQPGRRSRAAAE